MSQPAPGPNRQAISPDELNRARQILHQVRATFEAKVVGQLDLQRALLVTLLAGGHILLESVPGLAKTLSASTLAHTVHGSFARVQCTPDLLPSDIIGSQIYDAQSGTFVTQLGPVHANFVLLDEINRSSAKTQSAMLEAMQERQTTIGGQSFPLPKPFMVLATQNPIEEEGTYVLPQAQMDRFLLKEVIDYPTPAEEVTVLQRSLSGALAQQTTAQLGLNDVFFLQDLARRVYVDPAVQNYIVAVVNATREPQRFGLEKLAGYVEYGASPRASLAFQQVCQALAVLSGRGHVIPEDVRLMSHPVLRHRILLTFEAMADKVPVEQIIDELVGAVPTP